MDTPAAQPALIPQPRIAAKIGVHPRTLTRWTESKALGFPSPIMINGRRYWTDEGAKAIDLWLKSRSSSEKAVA